MSYGTQLIKLYWKLSSAFLSIIVLKQLANPCHAALDIALILIINSSLRTNLVSEVNLEWF